MPEQLSHEEIARMRQILADHDQQQPVRTIDLNNPPTEKYRFAEFPKMIYDLERSRPGKIVCRKVLTAQALAEALEDGWSEEAPAFGTWDEESLSPNYQSEANRVQEQLDAPRRGPKKKKNPAPNPEAAEEAAA